ncbi:MAG: hypothetical protein ABSH44_11380 [Bryobacteraceae bacterium]|jgi:hypothetical protein
MNEATKLSDSQRTALAKQLANYTGDIWEKAKDKYSKARSSRKQALITESLPDDARKMADGIVALRAKLVPLEDDFRAEGFEVDDDGDIEILCGDRRFGKMIEKKLDSELGTLEEVVTRPFDLARVKILLVATAEEAEKIIEPLLNFEVKAK